MPPYLLWVGSNGCSALIMCGILLVPPKLSPDACTNLIPNTHGTFLPTLKKKNKLIKLDNKQIINCFKPGRGPTTLLFKTRGDQIKKSLFFRGKKGQKYFPPPSENYNQKRPRGRVRSDPPTHPPRGGVIYLKKKNGPTHHRGWGGCRRTPSGRQRPRAGHRAKTGI